MATPRTRLAAWHLASSLLFTALTMVTGLLATPLLVQWLGKGPYGVARMIVEVFGYLTLLELGLGGGLGSVLARAPWRATTAPGPPRPFSSGLRVYFFGAALTARRRACSLVARHHLDHPGQAGLARRPALGRGRQPPGLRDPDPLSLPGLDRGRAACAASALTSC